MLSGRDALRSIERAIADLRDEEKTLAARVRETSDAIASMQTARAEQFRKLAEVRLDALRQGELDERLGRAERRARDLVAEHGEALDRIEKEIAKSDTRRARLTRGRDKAADALADIEQAYDSELAAFQTTFRKSTPFKQALAEAEAAERTVAEADRKAQIATADRTEKGEPYEADPLFMYLWARKFGTDAYASGGLTRFLDRWVARLIGYMDAAVNYRMLLELPKRLKDHAERVHARLDTARENLRGLEDKAAKASPLGARETELDKQRKRLAAIDDKIEAETEQRNALEVERGTLVRGDDSGYQQALSALTADLTGQDVRALYREARLTATEEDERIVDEIDDIDEDIVELEQDLSERRQALGALDRRRADLEAVRARYVRERYDGGGSYFESDDLLKSLLMGVLQGVLSGSGMWREIRRHHRRRSRADSDFGWRGFPGPGSGPILRPKSRRRSRSGGGFGFGGRKGGRGKGGGGFRTGGGF